jgi:hypothetical protein
MSLDRHFKGIPRELQGLSVEESNASGEPFAPCCKRSMHQYLESRLLDHLVRTQQYGVRKIETQSLSSLEIDDKPNLYGLLDRQVGRPRTFQDAAGIVAYETKRVSNA